MFRKTEVSIASLYFILLTSAGKQLGSYIWIGAIKTRRATSKWRWTNDNSIVDNYYTHWKPGVNIADRGKHCVAIWVQDPSNENFGNWEPQMCSNDNFFICAVL